MAINPCILLSLLFLLLSTATASAATEWNILNHNNTQTVTGGVLNMTLWNYCNSWRINLEVNNIRWFDVVPNECVAYVKDYMMVSGQYESDVRRATEECTLYLTQKFKLNGDGKDAWIFDVDQTLLSSVPFYKYHSFGAERIDQSYLEKWRKQGKAPAIKHVLCLYNHIKARGIKIFLISSRKEYLRGATANNLVEVGYHGWSGLILRRPCDYSMNIGDFKSKQRQKLVNDGYRIWGVVGSHWSGLFGNPSPLRIFKLPNPMYFE